MARYDLRFRPSVAGDLRGIPKADGRCILSRIEALRDDPRAPRREALVGGDGVCRVRQGACRIVRSIRVERRVVEVIRVVGRREVVRRR